MIGIVSIITKKKNVAVPTSASNALLSKSLSMAATSIVALARV
jgi:hypothetical protein